MLVLDASLVSVLGDSLGISAGTVPSGGCDGGLAQALRPAHVMESIKQKPSLPARGLAASALPDFRNLGVLLRVLLLVNVLLVLTVLIRVDHGEAFVAELLLMAGRVELPLFIVVLLLYLLAPRLARTSARTGEVAILAAVAAVVALSWPLLDGGSGSLGRALGWAVAAAAICLFYFEYRSRRLSPALTEARLLALTARIRPHFLFNSLNGVLGVIRSDPRRAERGLEELAELFRALMQDNRELVPLAEEIALCERYIDLERLRLGERLAVRWEMARGGAEGDALGRALVPPLMLQPLIENAVYHGIEPAAEAGEIVVRIARHGDELRLEVDNPVADIDQHRAGNRMALDNIRERLMLFFDLEAGLDIDSGGGRHRVRIRLPWRRASA